MIYAYPPLETADEAVLELINDQRRLLRHQVNANPVRWTGFLRRNTLARAIQGSNSIEGINANLSEAVEIVDDEKPDTLEAETAKALQNYRTAMTYVISIHNDPHTQINEQFVRMLHFMLMNYDMTKFPGQWRPGDIYVVREKDGDVVYEGPEASLVPGLMTELCQQMGDTAHASSTVLGAMAHLNLAMIHPFKDGNGRMARALQTLVIARDGIVSPEFSSIEEWLGRNTDAYYAILSSIGEGKWHPENSALPWVRFCLVAHYQQAATIMKRNATIGRAWEEIERVRLRLDLPERCEAALMDATFGYRVRNSRYRAVNDLSEVVASRDLRRLTEAGLITAVGEKRGRYYIAAAPLLALRTRIADRARAQNPYDLVGPRGA